MATPRLISIVTLFALSLSMAHCFDIYDRDEVTQTFSDSALTRVLVDNISGSVHVVGKPINEIRITAKRTIQAESGEKITEAKEDVKLDMWRERDRLEIVVTAPWRDGNHINYRGIDFFGYDVHYDFEIEVPREMMLFISTVNDGKIDVEDVKGKFELKNVNGPISATGLVAGGMAHTVNGFIDLTFDESPKEPCSFKTVNGKIRAEFPSDLAGIINIKTFNGKAFSDFEFQELPPGPMHFEEKNGRRIYRRGESSRVQVGTGGPELQFETLNGNIDILSSKQL